MLWPLHFFLLAVTPLLGSAAGVADELSRMVGKSTQQLANEHDATIRFLTKGTNHNHFGFDPWHVWGFKTPKNEPRYVIFSGQNTSVIPGNSSASIVLLSLSGAKLGMWSFSTGHRFDIKSASTSFDEDLHAQLITISTENWLSGQDIAKQHFALLDDKLYFIRVEDSKGRLTRNHYRWRNLTLGGDLPAKDLPGWAALLESPDLALRLAALTWVSGTHKNPDWPRTGLLGECAEDAICESVEDAKAVRAFRIADATKKRIEDYRHSDDSWLKEAAELASTPADESFW